MSDIVVSVEQLSKRYRLGVISHKTLTHDLQTWWARKRGNPDPNAKISNYDIATATVSDDEESLWALKDVSFDVKRGEIVGIIGRNGAGKSTLLKILSRVTTPTIGQVRVKGRIASLLEVGTGFHPELTGRENIYLNGSVLGMTKAEIRGKFDEIVQFAEIKKFIDTPVKRYSSGMYVRLAFAVAAHLDPEILIVDEVLAVGDYEFQTKCIGRMSTLSTGGATVLLVSHSMELIVKLCDSVVVLERGAIVLHDVPEKAVAHYAGSSYRNRTNEEGETSKKHEVVVMNAELHDDEGLIRNSFLLNEKIYISVSYRILVKELDLVVVLGFYNKNNVCLFVTQDFAATQQRVRNKGSYTSTIEIPPNFFAEDHISVNIMLTSSDSLTRYYSENSVLSFYVVEPASPEKTVKAYSRKHWPGVLRPSLSWSIAENS